MTGVQTCALPISQRSPDLGPQGAALEAVVNIAKETARRESLSQAVAKLKDHAKLAEIAIAQCAAMSTGLKNKIKVSMLTSGEYDDLFFIQHDSFLSSKSRTLER